MRGLAVPRDLSVGVAAIEGSIGAGKSKRRFSKGNSSKTKSSTKSIREREKEAERRVEAAFASRNGQTAISHYF